MEPKSPSMANNHEQVTLIQTVQILVTGAKGLTSPTPLASYVISEIDHLCSRKRELVKSWFLSLSAKEELPSRTKCLLWSLKLRVTEALPTRSPSILITRNSSHLSSLLTPSSKTLWCLKRKINFSMVTTMPAIDSPRKPLNGQLSTWRSKTTSVLAPIAPVKLQKRGLRSLL